MAAISKNVLNEKQKKFCEEYILDFNGTQAAIRCGYSKKTANEQAARLLANVSIQNYLTDLKQITAEASQITKEQLIEELRKISFFDIRKIFTVDGGMKNIRDFDDDSAAAIAGIESFDEKVNDITIGTVRKLKVLNKISAIERLSKMLGFDAPAKVAQTDTKGNDLPKYEKLSAEDLNILLLLEKKAASE